MSLGSIAHLQHYFARTGLLDGKGAQLARGKKSTGLPDNRITIVDTSNDLPTPSEGSFGGSIAHSPIEEEVFIDDDWEDPMMLPPTVSTYNHREQYIPPPPDTETLRHELKESLGHVLKALDEVKLHKREKEEEAGIKEDASATQTPDTSEDNEGPGQRSPGRGWHEIQGMHILDVVTLAIRAAKDYYTMHEKAQLLSKIKSERRIREELLGVMDVLKRMGIRGFAGGMKDDEISTIETWISNVEDLLEKEKQAEAQEIQDRQSWQWLEGDWASDDRHREWLFMKTFIENEEFPEWTATSEVTELPTDFLKAFANGLTLVLLHNRILKKSKRQYAEVKGFHQDTAKPYRAADNLRYWIKAAELRWETKLKVNVLGVVYNRGDEVWKEFEDAILQWCRAVREEITKEWKAGSVEVGAPNPGSI